MSIHNKAVSVTLAFSTAYHDFVGFVIKKVYDYSREIYLSRLTAQLLASEAKVSQAYTTFHDNVSRAQLAVADATKHLHDIRKYGSEEAERINREEGERQDALSLEIARVNGSNA